MKLASTVFSYSAHLILTSSVHKWPSHMQAGNYGQLLSDLPQSAAEHSAAFQLSLSLCSCISELGSSICPLAASEKKREQSLRTIESRLGKFYLAVFNKAVCASQRDCVDQRAWSVLWSSSAPVQQRWPGLADSRNKKKKKAEWMRPSPAARCPHTPKPPLE